MRLSRCIIGRFLLTVALWQVAARADMQPKSELILIDDIERLYRVYEVCGHE
jgi:UTP-glucose-1-phosphate uridylyltransferase